MPDLKTSSPSGPRTRPARKTVVSASVVIAMAFSAPIVGATSAHASACGTLGVNESLAPNTSLDSCNGQFRLANQNDGNVVLYHVSDGTPLWYTNTAAPNPGSLSMQSDGNLVLYTTDQQPLFWTSTTVPNSTLSVQDDGNVVIYAPAGKNTWDRISAQALVAAQAQAAAATRAALAAQVQAAVAQASAVNLKGTDNNDLIVGSRRGNDKLSGGAGNDTLIGLGSDKNKGSGGDIIVGGPGNDVLNTCGGSAADFAIESRQNGADTFFIDPGKDYVFGFEKGIDTAYDCKDLSVPGDPPTLPPGVVTGSVRPELLNDRLLPTDRPILAFQPISQPGVDSTLLAQVALPYTEPLLASPTLQWTGEQIRGALGACAIAIAIACDPGSALGPQNVTGPVNKLPGVTVENENKDRKRKDIPAQGDPPAGGTPFPFFLPALPDFDFGFQGATLDLPTISGIGVA